MSVLDELPPGRTPIVTRRVAGERADEVWEFVRKQVAQGRQAYIVYPVIEGARDDQPELDFSARSDPKPQPTLRATAPKTAERRKTAELFPDAHPQPTRQPPRRKAADSNPPSRCTRSCAPARLRACASACSMAVSMPMRKKSSCAGFSAARSMSWSRPRSSKSASTCPTRRVMVVEHAERFGLAQLHQLRGRVGRGAAKSYCILMTGKRVSPKAEERLNAMVRTQDGFELAELDLAMRGPGEFFGTRQAGLPEFRVANLVRDRKLLELAKQEAERFANPGPEKAREAGRDRSRARTRLGSPERSMATQIRPRRGRLGLFCWNVQWVVLKVESHCPPR